MTVSPIDPPADEPVVERITTEDPDPRPVIRFQVDDDNTILVARKPKEYVFIQLMRTAASNDEAVALSQTDEWMDAVLDRESAEYLRGRLSDPKDDFDMPQLKAIRDKVTGLWYGTPTGGPSGSGGPPRRSGKRSTAKRRSRG